MGRLAKANYIGNKALGKNSKKRTLLKVANKQQHKKKKHLQDNKHVQGDVGTRKRKGTKRKKRRQDKSVSRESNAMAETEQVVTREDIEFVNEATKYARTFAGTSLTQPPKKKRKAPSSGTSTVQRKNDKSQTRQALNGRKQVYKSNKVPAKLTSSSNQNISPKEKRIRRMKRIATLKHDLAEICQEIVRDPALNVERLEELQAMMSDEEASVQKYTLLSMLQVFRDVIPDYRIRLPTAAEMQVQLSAAVRASRKFEATLLANYRSYIHTLRKRVKNLLGRKQIEKVKPSVVALKCLCTLFKEKVNFNLNKEIMRTLVPFLNHPHDTIRHLVSDAITSNLGTRQLSPLQLEISRAIFEFIEKHDFSVQPSMVRLLLALPLQQLSSTNHGKLDLRGLKKKKDRDEIKTREEQAALKKAKSVKIQSKIMTEMFGVFFHILKLEDSDTELLNAALEGLAKFGFLINIDLLFDVVHLLAERLEELSLHPMLHCTIASFGILARSDGMDLDMQSFYQRVYSSLFEFVLPANWKMIPTLCDCLAAMFRQRGRVVPNKRVGAFVKRLMTLACSLPSHASLAISHTVRVLLSMYPRVQEMLDWDKENLQAHIYRPDVDEPEHCNALTATALWELSALSMSQHPFLELYSKDLGTWSDLPIELSTQPASTLLEDYDTAKGTFNPPVTWKSGSNIKKRKSLISFAAEKSEMINEETVDDGVFHSYFDTRLTKASTALSSRLLKLRRLRARLD